MKQLITLSLLCTSLGAGAQSFDFFAGGGRYIARPSGNTYSSSDAQFTANVYAYHSYGYYLRAGGDWTWNEKTLQPGLQLAADFISYRLAAYTYYTYSGYKVGGQKRYSDIRYLRVAPGYTLSRRIDCLTISAIAGPDYTLMLQGGSGYIGVHGGLRVRYRAVALQAGYALGIGHMLTGNDDIDQSMPVRNRDLSIGLQVHLRSLFSKRES